MAKSTKAEKELYIKDKKYHKVLGLAEFNGETIIATENGTYKGKNKFTLVTVNNRIIAGGYKKGKVTWSNRNNPEEW